MLSGAVKEVIKQCQSGETFVSTQRPRHCQTTFFALLLTYISQQTNGGKYCIYIPRSHTNNGMLLESIS